MPIDPILLYIDLKSPYSYIAAHRALALEAEARAAFDIRPYALDIGSRANANPEAFLRRARYLYRDARRFAAPLGLILKGPQRIYDSSVANIGLLFAAEAGARNDYIAAVYARFFNRDLELDDPGAITALLSDCGADADAFDAYRSGAGKAAYESEIKAAEEKGVFAVPTFVVGEELYWGQDRMDMAMAAAGIA
jgi:2-hydroxychromene-2-carboxylate isomerase